MPRGGGDAGPPPRDRARDRIDELLREPGRLVWLDLLNSGADEVELLQRDFGVHPLAIEEAQQRGQRPKLDTYGDQYVVIAYKVLHARDDTDADDAPDVAEALDANLASTSNSLNSIMKRLTAFTVVLMVPTLIAGIYGMNFHFMPELGWPIGYPFALALMALAIIAAITYFGRKGWF